MFHDDFMSPATKHWSSSKVSDIFIRFKINLDFSRDFRQVPISNPTKFLPVVTDRRTHRRTDVTRLLAPFATTRTRTEMDIIKITYNLNSRQLQPRQEEK